MTACQIFGYNKSSILGLNVKVIIPEIIGKHHDRVLYNAEKKDVSYFNRKRSFFTYGRQVSGYVFPLHLNVKKVMSFTLEGDQYVGLITPLQFGTKVQEMHILLNRRLRIVGLSETCFRILKLDKDIIKRQKIVIHTLIPDFPKFTELKETINIPREKQNLLGFTEDEMDVFIPEITEMVSDKKKLKEDSNSEDNDSVLSTLRKNEVVADDSFLHYKAIDDSDSANENEDYEEDFYALNISPERKIHCKVGIMPMFVTEFIGYAVKLTTLEPTNTTTPAVMNVKQGKYQLYFSLKCSSYLRVAVDKNNTPRKEGQNFLRNVDAEYLNFKNNESPITTIIMHWRRQQPTVLISKLRELNKKLKDMRPEELIETLSPEFFERVMKQRVYDKGVKLKSIKIVKNLIIVEDKEQQNTNQHIEHDKLDDVGETPEANEEGKTLSMRSKNDKAENLLGDKDTLKEALEKQKLTLWITRIFIISMILFVLGFALIYTIEFIRFMNPFWELRDTFIIKEYSIRKTSEVLFIKYNVRCLLFLESGWIDKASESEMNAELQSRIQHINDSYYRIKQYDEILKTTGRDYSNKKLIENFLNQQIQTKMYTVNGPVTYSYTFDEVNEQISAAIFTIINYKLNKFNETDENVYFFMENTLKQRNNRNFLDTLYSITQMYKEKEDVIRKQNKKLFREFFIMMWSYIPIMIILIFALYFRIRKKKLIVMNFFLNIPSKSLEEIIKNCDDFIAELSSFDKQADEVDKAEEEVLLIKSDNDGTGSCFSISTQRYQKKYKKHRLNQKRALEDNCFTITIIVLKFALICAAVMSYFLIYYFVSKANNDQFYNAGHLGDTNNRVEIESLELLVLMKESIDTDRNAIKLSDMYYQMLDMIEESISLIEGLQDVSSFVKTQHELSDKYKSLVLNSACLSEAVNTGVCENMFNEVTKLGLLSVLSYYRRLNNELYGIFLTNRNNYEEVKELLNSYQIEEYEMLMLNAIRPVARELSDAIITEIRLIDSKNSNIETAFFSASMAILGVVFIFLLVPYMNSLKDQMKKIHFALAGIPLEILVTNPKFIQYIGKERQTP